MYDLAKIGTADEIRNLTGLLFRPPVVTWALHIALLNAAVEAGLRLSNIGGLQDVDNLYVQEAVAKINDEKPRNK